VTGKVIRLPHIDLPKRAGRSRRGEPIRRSRLLTATNKACLAFSGKVTEFVRGMGLRVDDHHSWPGDILTGSARLGGGSLCPRYR
jgi:hypothetical protein